MPGLRQRRASVTGSEVDVDISAALLQDPLEAHNGNDSDDDREDDSTFDQTTRGRALGEIPNLEQESTDDEAFIADSLAAAHRKAQNVKGRSVKKGGGFQALGLNANLFKAIARKGFSVPTPIQRKTIPLVLEGQDVVGMARTGSGKTAAFVIPLIEKLKTHSARVGARALIMSPSRELALQTLKTVKELGRGTDLRSVLLVGGDSLEEQFDFMSNNPDIIICTPGRFLHLKVEMGLDLSSIHYVVFDEADRLFEMGFAAQLTEILHALPSSRQTLLFSATLPKSLVEFARAGLQEPNLVRLDAESKISPDLQTAHFTLKSEEREGALIHLLQDVAKVPLGDTPAARERSARSSESNGKKRKREESRNVSFRQTPTEHSTIIFVATKHHVEYIATLLRRVGWSVSHAYGSLDQTARKIQVEDFRTGMTNLLVVTDVAARGIDIPVLANVINYDFPSQPKIFVHRVGRTARAGQSGWAYTLVRPSDAPYLLDLQLFLGRRLVLGDDRSENLNFALDLVVGSLPRKPLEASCELAGKLLDEDPDIDALCNVAAKGERLYLRTRNSASSESARRARDITASASWISIHPLFKDITNSDEHARMAMLAKVSGFKPTETIFELGKGGHDSEAALTVKKRRAMLERKRQRGILKKETSNIEDEESYIVDPTTSIKTDNGNAESPSSEEDELENMFDSQEDGLQDTEIIISEDQSKSSNRKDDNYRSSEFFMSYTPSGTNAAEDRGYGVHSGGNTKGNFLNAARDVTLDLQNDDGAASRLGEPSRMRWDKRSKKYVNSANDTDGSKGARFIRGESGQKISASFKSGRFDAWKRKSRLGKMPRTGEAETSSAALSAAGRSGAVLSQSRHYRHRSDKAPKDADKYRDDYHKQRKLVEKAKEDRRGRFRDGPTKGHGKNELRDVSTVHRERVAKAKRREKSSGGKKGRRGTS